MYHAIEFLIHVVLLHLYICVCVYICYIFRSRHANVQTILDQENQPSEIIYTYYLEYIKNEDVQNETHE